MLTSSSVVLKDGTKISGIIWRIDLRHGYFMVMDGREDRKINMRDCASVVTLDKRIGVSKFGDQDMLAKWSKDIKWMKSRGERVADPGGYR